MAYAHFNKKVPIVDQQPLLNRTLCGGRNGNTQETENRTMQSKLLHAVMQKESTAPGKL